MNYSGTWRITKMELWSADYFDMEVEAFIKINPNGSAIGCAERREAHNYQHKNTQNLERFTKKIAVLSNSA